MTFDYLHISTELRSFENCFSIGRTAENRQLFCVSIGEGEKNAVFAACFHGLEYLTAAALLEFTKKYVTMNEYHKKLRLFFIPMMNPDGAEIALHGLNPKNVLHQNIIKEIGIIDVKNMWQANSMGVDINHNFDADWKSIYLAPQPSRYGGKYPESELETRALVKFLKRTEPELFIAFHSQGKEIYYDFNGLESESAKENAEYVAKITGYEASVPEGTATFGGAKDYYIQEYHKEAYTVELGMGKNPLPHSALPEMINDVYNIGRNFIEKTFPN